MIAADSNVIIAALLSWHEFHERAIAALENALARRRLLLPSHALIESYSVMTRLPSPHRLAPAVAHQLLHESFAGAPVAALSSRKVWSLLGDAAAESIAGGRIFDAAIARAAIDAGARELLTFNPRDFEPFAERIAIVVP